MDRFKLTLKHGLTAVILLGTLFPIYWMFVIATQHQSDLFAAVSLWPRSLTLDHFVAIFKQENVMRPLINSLIITVVSLLATLFTGLSCAYVLGRSSFRVSFKKPLLIWILLLRVLPPITFALPLYIMMNNAGINHTRIPIILAHILINLPFVVWFMMVFFASIPGEIEESARVDGASEFVIYAIVILPLVVPGIAAVTILSFMASWNEYLYSMIFIQRPRNFTIPLKLATLNSEQELTEWGKVASGGIISVIPVMLAAAFMQNHLMNGLTAGAVKQ